MERLKDASPALARKAKESRPNRSAASNRRGKSKIADHSGAPVSLSLIPGTGSDCGEKNNTHSLNQRLLNTTDNASNVANSTQLATDNSASNHADRQNVGGLGKAREPPSAPVGTSKSLISGAQATSLCPTTASVGGDAQGPTTVFSLSPSPITDGASMAAVPSLPTLTYPGVEKADDVNVCQSYDSLNEVRGPLAVDSPQPSRNQIDGMGSDAAAAPSAGRDVEARGAALHRQPHRSSSSSHLRSSQFAADEAKMIPTTSIRQDVGPLPAPKAHTRHRLSSGTHIRRRPRSVLRTHTSAVSSTSNGIIPASMLGYMATVSPANDALDPTYSDSNAFRAPPSRQGDLTAASVGAGASGGDAVDRRATGLMRNGLSPATATREAAAGGHRRRADPSPAPSRPPRSRKTRAGAVQVVPVVGPSSTAFNEPSFSQSSPAQHSMRVTHPLGVSSPPNFSLDRSTPFFVGHRDGVNHANTRSGRSGAFSAVASALPASAKPPSGRRHGAVPRALTPKHHTTSSGPIDAPSSSSPQQDYAKLTAMYIQLCTEVGDEPNMNWVAALSSTQGAKHQQDILSDSATLNTPEAKELTLNPKRMSSFSNGSCDTSEHLLPPSALLQQQHTPRGGARPRLAGATVLPSLGANATHPLAIASKRASTPGARHGSSNSQLGLSKRSGSAGRITPVNRPSIFGLATRKGPLQQPQKYGNTGADHTPRLLGSGSPMMTLSLVGMETAKTDVYAHRVSKYCAERLQPFADSMRALKDQRTAVALALQSFLHVASPIFTTCGAALTASETAEGSEMDGAGQRSAGSTHGHHHGGYGNPELDSGKKGERLTTATSSMNTTPRKASVSQYSAASSLSNTVVAVTSGHSSKRPSTTAAAKAASLSEALENLQGAVITLLGTLGDSAVLAQAPENRLGSSMKCIDQDSPPPPSRLAPMETTTLSNVPAGSLLSPAESSSDPFPGAWTAAQLASPISTPPIVSMTSSIISPALVSTDGCNSGGPPVVPQLILAKALALNGISRDQLSPWQLNRTSVPGMQTCQAEVTGVGASVTAMTAALGNAPSRFVEFVRAQEREVAVQLGELCRAVRDALGSPVTALEAATARRLTHNGAESAASTPMVCLEAADMLSTPFFVPPKYFNDLVTSMMAQGGDSAAVVDDATSTTVVGRSCDAPPKSIKASALANSVKRAAKKKLKSSKQSSGSGRETPSRSSTSSSPRVSGMTVPYTPHFTPHTAMDDDDIGDGGGDSGPPSHSVSARSTGGASGTTSTSVESYLLHCVLPGPASTVNAGQSVRTCTELYSTRSPQSKNLNWTTTDVSSKAKVTHGGGAASSSSLRTTGFGGSSKQTGNSGVVKSGRAGGGGGSIYQSRPALSTPVAVAPAEQGKASKKSPTAPTQLQQRQYLIKAWAIWTALQPLAAHQGDASNEPSSLSPHQSLSSPVMCGRLGHGPLAGHGCTAPPPATSAPMAAATPSTAISSATRKWSLDNEAKLLSTSPSPLGTSHTLTGQVNDSYSLPVRGRQGDEEDNVLCSQTKVMHAYAAESASSLPSLPSASQRLNPEDVELLSPRHDDAPSVVTTQLIATTPPQPPTATQQHIVGPSGSMAAAARQIAVWWASLRCFRRAAAEQQSVHHIKNAEQRQKVFAARRNAFLWLWVCRRRLRRLIEERRQQQQQQQGREADALAAAARGVADVNEKTAKTRGNELEGNGKTSSEAATVSSTGSRERFQRAREQRKGALASSAALTSSTAQSSSCSSETGGGARDCKAPFIPASVSPLPLATSGISTFDLQDYHGESNSFTVSAIHRLLNAPPSLLYATCTAALRYPANAPMAYLDNSCGSAANYQSNGGEERQQSEAPPAMNDAHGGMVGITHHHQSLSGSSPTNPDDTRTHTLSQNHQDGSAVTAQQRRWIEAGVLYIRFSNLRRYHCCAYEVLIPSSDMNRLIDDPLTHLDRGSGLSSHEGIVNSETRTRSRSSPAVETTLPVPVSTRYESVVDANELHHAKPVVKPFHRPFEQWGMAYNLTSRVFCAAAIYAWQLIFSHTPFDDAKQRELPTREEQQARLERVEDRNGIILDCYGVRSEREWIREATKDLTFVGQIYLPSYDTNDPEQQQESRDNYDFVKNFLYQCFPSIDKLGDIHNYLVGAGLFFVLKEVFHYTKDSPSAQRMQEYLPQLLLVEGQSHLTALSAVTSALSRHDADAGREREDLISPSEAVDDNKALKGLSGRQRAALQRYEQLRQLHHLSYSLNQEKTKAGINSGAGAGRLQRGEAPAKSQQWQRRTGSPVAPAISIGSPAKESAKARICSSSSDSNDLASTKKSGTPAKSPDSAVWNRIATIPASRLSLMRAAPVSAAPECSPFVCPEGSRKEILAKQKGSDRTRTSSPIASAAPARDASVQLVRVPHHLLRPSAEEARYLRDFEEEVSKSIHCIIQAWKGSSSRSSLGLLDVRAALMAGATLQDELDIAYPRHFLVKLSETLAFQLFGLQLSLSSCEDLDAMGQ